MPSANTTSTEGKANESDADMIVDKNSSNVEKERPRMADSSISSRSPIKVSLADHTHTCSGIYHKLSFLQFDGGCGRHNPLIGRRRECSFVLFCELANIPEKIPCFPGCASSCLCDGPSFFRVLA